MKKLKVVDVVGMDAMIKSSPDETMLTLPTWLVRGYVALSNDKARANERGKMKMMSRRRTLGKTEYYLVEKSWFDRRSQNDNEL